jgi:hypothetical protein
MVRMSNSKMRLQLMRAPCQTDRLAMMEQARATGSRRAP